MFVESGPHADPNATSPEKALACAVVARAVEDLMTTRKSDVDGVASVEATRDEAIAFFTGGGEHAFMRNHWFSMVGLDEEIVYEALKPHLKGRQLMRFTPSAKSLPPTPLPTLHAEKKNILTPDEKDALLTPMFTKPTTVREAAIQFEGKVGDTVIRDWLKQGVAAGTVEATAVRGQYVLARHLNEAA